MPTKKTTKKAVKKKTAKKVAKKATKKTTTKKVVKKVAQKATKKTAKKVAKKATKKTTKKSSKKDIVYSESDQAFWMSDGQILNSLIALRDALDEMEKDVYAYHADGWQNDFAQWVEIVLGDPDCADDLRKAKTPRSAKTVVVRHLKLYSI